MQGMSAFEDGYFDLAIVDPPYGISAEAGTGDYSKALFKGNKKSWDTATPSASYFSELRRISKEQIIWGGNYFSLPATRGFVIWYKTEELKDRDFSECEFAWTSFNRPSRLYSCRPFQRNGSHIHPTQKPVALYKWLLKNYAKEGDKILDTHLGSGSSRIAAFDGGFEFWGYELDKDYFDASEKRFQQHKSQLKLFV